MIQFGTGGWRAIIGDGFTKANVRLLIQGLCDRMAALGLYIKTNSSITDTAQIVSGQTVAAGTQLDHGTVVEVTLVTSDSSMLGRY